MRLMFAALAALLLHGPGWAQPAESAALRARFAAIQPLLAASPLHRPMQIESAQSDRSVRGEVYAVLEHPFSTVAAELSNPDRWCDVMMLHLNNKSCRRSGDVAHPRLELRVGKKYDQPVAEATSVAFTFHAVSATPEYLRVELHAADGPFDTHDYRIVLEAVPLDGGRSFIHMDYSFGFGALGHLALKVYLAMAAGTKVGFTQIPPAQPGQSPGYIGGMRGLVERNTMRYFLAIDTFLGALSAAPAEQQEKRLRAWFDGTERHARQLHEMDRDAYLAMKRDELRANK